MKIIVLTKAILVAVLALAATALPANAETMCTMDAMQCPDGTWTGRSGPNCEFVCGGPSGGGTPGYDGNTGSKPAYPTTSAPVSSGEYVDIMKADIESGQLKPIDLPSDIEQAGRIEQENLSTKEDQSSETGYLKNLIDSIFSFIGGLFNWN